MSNKRPLFISIHHGGDIPTTGNTQHIRRIPLGILVAPKKSSGCDNMAYDVSDGVRLNSETGEDLNTARDWFFRTKNNVNPLDSGRLIVS